MYKEMTDSTEVLLFMMNLTQMRFVAARARQRLSAAIVWERCGSFSDRDTVIHRILDSLNLAYELDRVAFEDLITSDRIIIYFRTSKGKTKFFETTCRKDPSNSYVRQHYGRMLHCI